MFLHTEIETVRGGEGYKAIQFLKKVGFLQHSQHAVLEFDDS